ncbi:NAD(+) synthase [Fuerstiella marisgermanici]|uniref:Glutamine-dependent NAD(+) synthetase n=1 Tax=Fuerstiella marisgermanici TaxID=1891926 RepID=A0A1P8WHT9_9PLAN|nr:NAD(+) synthase [Fuerstiella marisgermanici]APZ93625.1 Glutamine-dependent NAD(+) synthetase [Fuerstiella marisgermanici]
MKRLRLGAAILNQTPLDWEGNTDRILAAIEMARSNGVSVLCLPELCITGYGCEDMFVSSHTWRTAWDMLQKIIPATKGMILSIGLPLYITNGVYNVACIAADRKIVGIVPKQHLAGDGLHYEPRWFRAWPAETISEYSHDGSASPIGDLIFECDGVRFGFEICEDAWVAGRPGNRMAECGVDVILNPSASHFAFGKHEIRKRFVLEGSRAFGVSYIYANLVGNEAGRAIYDGGALIASAGELIAAGPRFGFRDVDVTVADVDIDLSRTRRAAVHATPFDVTDDVQERIAHVPGTLETPDQPYKSTADVGAESEFSEFTQAISLALFDYMRKSYSNGFVVSMSGGADSSATACLIRCMVERATADLGIDGFLQKVAYLKSIAAANDLDAIMSQLFTGVYQATRNSSETTRSAAEAVTKCVGGTYHELDVDGLVAGYTQVVEGAIGRELKWETDDITLQNIQARTRSPAIWMFANLKNALLLSTSNRSEAAVGYATMDGDTSGGLSPIAGIDKAFLRDWLKVMEADGSAGVAAIPTLSLVNQQQPTAELRPSEYDQTDEGDLMPYPILDEIENYAIGDKLAPAEVLQCLVEQHPEIPKDQLSEWLKRFFRLWSRNQWKRERYAPSFHVDDKNLDPRTWCRFPILSGGFRHELSQLD